MKRLLLSLALFILGYLTSELVVSYQQQRDWFNHRMALTDFARWLHGLPYEGEFKLPSAEELNKLPEYGKHKAEVIYWPKEGSSGGKLENRIIAWGTRLSPRIGARLFITGNWSSQLAFDSNVDWLNGSILKTEEQVTFP